MGGLTACRLLESSADLHDVRDVLGHAHITTTSRYVRSTPVRLAQALERMEAAIETLVDADDQPHLLQTWSSPETAHRPSLLNRFGTRRVAVLGDRDRRRTRTDNIVKRDDPA